MINRLLDFIAPHHCFECQKIGSLLCVNCKYNIVNEPFSQCLHCLGPTNGNARCTRCALPYTQAWCVGERRDALQVLIDSYKMGNLKDAPVVLGDMIAEIIPRLPATTQIVPIPTISKHIRQRGYDHTRLMSEALQRRCGGQISPLLLRRTHSVQRGATKSQRLRQARQAFRLHPGVPPMIDSPHLIVDDVYTTGATLEAAAALLRGAGVREIWVAVGVREPLD